MWSINDGLLLIETDENTKYYPKAIEIYNAISNGKVITINGEKYALDGEKLPLRFSKIGISSKLVIKFNNNRIICTVNVTKNGINYITKNINNVSADYIIIDDVWYFLSGEINYINELIDKYHIVPGESVSYREYMKLSRELKESDVLFEDEVGDVITHIKDNPPDDSETELLKADLFHYQKVGLNWMNFMVNNGCGCLLGDEMGLGKTLQVISLFGSLKETGKKHFLVIAPVSLLINWQREIMKFYPSLTTLIHHGSHRSGRYTELMKYDVVIMSYSNVQTDLSMLNMIKWDVVAIDEAQNIKNPYSIRSKCVRKIEKNAGVAITGTPFENHMTDIWSIVDFVMPGYLGSLSDYEKNFEDSVSGAAEVEKYLSPIMIRRRVAEVAKDLPERIDIPQPVPMTENEAQYYEDERTSVKKEALKVLTIEKMQKLRMFCTHPHVYDPAIESFDPSAICNKYARACELLDEIFKNKEKAIIFTSFNRMFEIFSLDIPKRFGVTVKAINGSTPPDERQKIVDCFSEIDGPALLVLNPRAAGTGLNITSANHVIHYNLEWNPAIEDQASARAYRRGQKKTVFVYRLYYTDTIEEIIDERIRRKRELFDSAVIGNVGDFSEQEDLIRALNISPHGGNL